MTSCVGDVAESFGCSHFFLPQASWSPNGTPGELPPESPHKAAENAPHPVTASFSVRNPPPETNASTAASGDPPRRVFLRLPDCDSGEPWLVPTLTYWKLQRLISPGRWNNGSAPVRAYVLRRTSATRGIVLVEHADLIDWLNECFRKSGIPTPPIPAPQITLPPVL